MMLYHTSRYMRPCDLARKMKRRVWYAVTFAKTNAQRWASHLAFGPVAK